MAHTQARPDVLGLAVPGLQSAGGRPPFVVGSPSAALDGRVVRYLTAYLIVAVLAFALLLFAILS